MRSSRKIRGFASPGRWTFAAAIGAIGCGQGAPAAPPEPDLEALAQAVSFPATVSAGESHACVNSKGMVKCWGNNTEGKLGLGNTLNRGDTSGEMDDNLPWVDLGQTTSHLLVSSVVAGGGHSCAILSDGSLKCWGGSAAGQLGIATTNPTGDNPGEMGTALPYVNLGPGRRALSVALGLNHTCALLDNGSVKCWGANAYGQLGLGDTNSRGATQAQMDSLPPVDLGLGRVAWAIAAGGNHTCAIISQPPDGGLHPKSLACWGRNSSGQLGINTTSNRGDGPGEMGSALGLAITGAVEVSKVSVGADHTCALLTDGKVKCWGLNSSGQLGLGNTVNRGGTANDMQSLPVLDLGFTVRATDISSRRNHTCVRFIAGDSGTTVTGVKCWGNNGFGQLGRGDTSNRGNNSNEMGDFLTATNIGFTESTVAAGGEFSCASAQTGVKCWGRGTYGVIGQGNTTSRGDDPGEMGTNLAWVPLGTPPDGGAP